MADPTADAAAVNSRDAGDATDATDAGGMTSRRGSDHGLVDLPRPSPAQSQGAINMSPDKPLPELKRASETENGGAVGTSPPRLHIPRAYKHSPTSSQSSMSASASASSPNRGVANLSESLEAALGGSIGGMGGTSDQRGLVSASSGVNVRAVGSPSSSTARRERRGERGKSLPTGAGRGRFDGGSAAALSSRSSPRTSQSPDGKRSSMSFVDFVAASNTELTLLDASRLAGVKRPRDRDALRVAVRVRPLIERELGSRTVTCEGGGGRMVVVNPKKFKASADAVVATASAVSRANMATSDWLRPFDFDRVFWSTPRQRGAEEEGSGRDSEQAIVDSATQDTVYEGLGQRIVDDALNGFNCSCFAYGHTGSGKTYSMFGCGDEMGLPLEDDDLAAPPDGEAFGLVPRVCFDLLQRLRAGDQGRQGVSREAGASSVGLSVEMIEIYNDKIRDLLHPAADSSAFRVREHPQRGPYVENLVPVQVESWSQLRQVLSLGCSARTEADTAENCKSSRGHAILTLEIQSSQGATRVQMVDLAGSERETIAKVSPGDARGGLERGASGTTPGKRTLSQRLRETAQIKKALSNLGIIIKGLSKGDTLVGLPFRDSILTWLLKEALSGRARTTMLATVSPSSNCYVETMNTLKYAERLRRASAHLNFDREANGPPITKPSDGMKKEMQSLVEKLGEEGREARRQVLYQTVSDPQQRIAKLTARDPRRRRTCSGGSSMAIGGRRLTPETGRDQRRTSFPGTPSPARFGWTRPTPSPAAKAIKRSSETQAAWGSPIEAPGEVSIEMADADADAEAMRGAGVEEEKSGEESAETEGGAPVPADAGTGEGIDARNGTNGAGSMTQVYPDLRELGGGSVLGEPASLLYSSESGGSDGGFDEGRRNDAISTSRSDALREDELADDGEEAYPDAVDEEREPFEERRLGSNSRSDNDEAGDDGSSNDTDEDLVSKKHDMLDAEKRSGGTIDSPGSALAEGVEGACRSPMGSDYHDDGLGDDAANPLASELREHQLRTPSPRNEAAAVWTGISSDEEEEEAGDERVDARAIEDHMRSSSGARAGLRTDERIAGDSLDIRRSDEGVSQEVRVPVTSVRIERHGPTDAGATIAEPRVLGGVGRADMAGAAAAASTTVPRRIRWAGHERGGTSVPGVPLRQRGASHAAALETERKAEEGTAGGDGDARRMALLHSSVESGGGAAALAASGVFDITGTSAETEPDAGGDAVGSIDDADSLDDLVDADEEGTWPPQAPQRIPTRSSRPRNEGETPVDGTGAGEDAQAIINSLLRQIAELKTKNAHLEDELLRLQDELRRSKEGEEEAWSLGQDTAREFKTRLTALQRDLSDQMDNARKADERAREAGERAADVSASADALSEKLEAALRRARDAEEREAEAQAQARQSAFHADNATAEIRALQAELQAQTAIAERAEREARESSASVDAAGRDAHAEAVAAVSAARRAGDRERDRAIDAEARADRATARARELVALVDEHDKRLAKARQAAEAEGVRAEEAEARTRLATARVEELQGVADDKDERLARATEALDAEETRVEKAEGRAQAAECRVRELKEEADRARRASSQALSEADVLRAETGAAAEADLEQAAASRDAAIEERDRTLDQVEAERKEVLRLTAELKDTRHAAQQESRAARDREDALRTLLANESEVSRAEQVELEDLLLLISRAQHTDGDGSGDVPSGEVSVSAARATVETQQADLAAARRRMRALEDENDQLRRVEEDVQGTAEALHLVEEERDFLLGERGTLNDRLGALEERQRSLQEQAAQAEEQEEEADAAMVELEDESRRLKGQLIELEDKLRAAKEEMEREADGRRTDAENFMARIKEEKEHAKGNVDATIEQVMRKVKSQASQMRGTLSSVEEQRDEAVKSREAAKAQIGELTCQLEELTHTYDKAKKEFDEQAQQSSRERAALWLAVNKLDVLEAAKDAAIKELQEEVEEKSRVIKVLQAHNAALARELGQVDMSLMQALEDNGLTLDSVNLQNTTISRRIGRRRLSARERRSNGNGHTAAQPPEPDAAPLTVDREGSTSDQDHVGQPFAVADSFETFNGDQEGDSPDRRSRGPASRDPSSRPARTHSLARSQAEYTSNESARHLSQRARGTAGASGRRQSTNGADDQGDRMHAADEPWIGRDNRETYIGPTSAPRADRWDPAMHTIEREIEQLSERLRKQPRAARPTAKVRRGSTQDVQEDHVRPEDQEAARHTPAGAGKRLRARSSEASPTSPQHARRARREHSDAFN